MDRPILNHLKLYTFIEYIYKNENKSAHGHVGEEERGLEEGEDEAGERGEGALVQEAPGGGEQPEAAGAHEAEDGVDGCFGGVFGCVGCVG